MGEGKGENDASLEDLLWDKTVVKQVVVAGKLGPRPEWGDEVRLRYTLRENLNCSAARHRAASRIFRMRKNWAYVIGDDDESFLPRRFAEVVLMSMAVGEKSKFVIKTQCFAGDESFVDAPWLHSGTDGYERVDVEEIEYDVELLELHKGEKPMDLVPALGMSGVGVIMTKRRPLRESLETFSMCNTNDEVDNATACQNPTSFALHDPGSKCGLTGKAAYAGRDWLPWGDDGHPDSTWNTIQETKATALRLRGSTGHLEPTALAGYTAATIPHEIPASGVSKAPSESETTKASPVEFTHKLAAGMWNFGLVRLQVEALDAWGTKLLPRQVLTYVHGQGEQPDCIEVAVSTMILGESCEVRCHSRSALRGCQQFQKVPWLPVSYRLKLEAVEAQQGLGLVDPLALPMRDKLVFAARMKRVAASLYRQGRHFLAREKYQTILSSIDASITHCEDIKQRRALVDLRRHCKIHCAGCELRLELWNEARKTAEMLLADEKMSVEGLTLRAQALLQNDPKAARQDLLEAAKLDPTSRRIQKLLEKSSKEIKRHRRAKTWFDGQGTDFRTSQANESEICFQCNRLRPGGRLADDTSKHPGRYFCTECWECWVKIRRHQQRELDRRLDKAIHSDYSTQTDELPSLDDVPKDWNSAHPMWKRQKENDPDWQLAHLDEKAKAHIQETNARRAARLEAQRLVDNQRL